MTKQLLIIAITATAMLAMSATALSAGPDTGGWMVAAQTSPVDDSANVYASVEARNLIHSTFRLVRPSLNVMCKENVTWAYIDWKTFIGTDTTPVLTRLDKDRARTSQWDISTDYKATFVPSGAIGFIKKMMQRKKLLAVVTPYGENQAMVTFDLRGLTEAIKPLRKACHW